MRARPYLPVLLAIAVLLLAACLPSADRAPARSQLVVFAAASLSDVFTELGRNFEAANPGTEVIFSFAGSQQLAAQIGEGAPADLFASANAAQMQVAVERGRVAAADVQPFAGNRLVLITPADNPAAISSLQDLTQPGLRLVIADGAVPVGRYTLDVLAKASALPEYSAAYSETVLRNVVSYEEDVRAVLAKIVLGEGDAGIVYRTDAAGNAAALQVIEIPDNLNSIAVYPIAPLNDSPQRRLAEAFIGYVRSDEGRRIVAQYGFIAP